MPNKQSNKPFKLAYEVDDYGPKNNGLVMLEQIREHYPNFKITMFTIPWDIRFGSPSPITDKQWEPWVEATKQAVKDGWMEIALHGLTHVPMEFDEIDYEEAMKRMVVGEKMLQNVGIPYVKIFKAPHWAISAAAKRAVETEHEIKGETYGGFQVVEDRYYDWNLADPRPKQSEFGDQIIIGHGHVQNVVNNGIEETMPKLMDLPTDTEFYLLSEALHEREKTKAKEAK